MHDVHVPLRCRYFLGDMGEEVDAFAEDFRLLASVKRRSKTAHIASMSIVTILLLKPLAGSAGCREPSG
jgi:hypothetical protein